jgi:hypothetical protein
MATSEGRGRNGFAGTKLPVLRLASRHGVANLNYFSTAGNEVMLAATSISFFIWMGELFVTKFRVSGAGLGCSGDKPIQKRSYYDA